MRTRLFQREHVQLGAGVVAAALALGVCLPQARGDAKAKTIGVDEIKDGMKGYGLTVFKGTEPERFDVEVVGVLKNFRPSQALILVKTPHPRLNVTKNVKGMSGSPIYFDGRLAGAYAYSLASFQAEPVAGVTPIDLMLKEMRRPIPAGFWPLERGAPLPRGAQADKPEAHAAVTRGTTSFGGEAGRYDLEAHASELAARLRPASEGATPNGLAVRASTPLMMAGLTDRAAAYAKKLFEPMGLEPLAVGGGGSMEPNAPKHYVDGGAVGVQMSGGDVSMMGLGTVTHVEGTRLCAFGHPMMEAGVTAMPAVIGRVHWIYASEQHSFKVGDPVRQVGALVNDRQSAIVVDETARAPVFPVKVEVVGAVGAPKTSWNLEVAEERFTSPAIVASAYGSIVDATANERRDVTWKLVSKLTVRGKGTLELTDFGVAVGGMPDAGDFARSRLVRAIGDVLNNPFENASVEKVESTLVVEYARQVVRLRGAELLTPVVAPGDKARIRVQLVPFAGPATSKVIDVPMPAELEGQSVEIEIVPGYELGPELAAPQSLPELLANETRQSYEPRSLVAQMKLKTQGVAHGGRVADRLPSFALDALRPQSSDVGPEPFASYARTVVPVDRYVEGRDKVKVRVEKPVR